MEEQSIADDSVSADATATVPVTEVLLTKVTETEAEETEGGDEDAGDEVPIIDQVTFREVHPTDIPVCAALERDSYPADEAASLSTLQYRQHHAAPYFRCAVLNEKKVIGYICSTKCREFTSADTMTTHDPNGTLLAIHSVVVHPEYRKLGIGTSMLQDYVRSVPMGDTMEKFVLLSKKDLLTFYVKCGFQVIRPSPIVHGKEQWYELHLEVASALAKADVQDRNVCDCYIVDAFANPETIGTGNPAAVVLVKNSVLEMAEHEQAQWMQAVAAEFNLSETAFLWELQDEQDFDGNSVPVERQMHYGIRYFTPAVEVPLCGHATLASAAVLYQTAVPLKSDTITIVFHAKENILKADLAASNKRFTKITMEFPVKPAIELTERSQATTMLKNALGVDPADVIFVGLSEIGDVLFEVTGESFEALQYSGLNYDAFRSWDGYSRGVIVCSAAPEQASELTTMTTASPPQYDFKSRFFAPKAGIDEDPVTGSAHCVLAPYFSTKLQKDRVIGWQQSQRGGVVECCMTENSTVRLTGIAVTVVAGSLLM